jgi:hypothetical protein
VDIILASGAKFFPQTLQENRLVSTLRNSAA